MYYRYNEERYKIILGYKFVSRIHERDHDGMNNRLAKTAENAAYHSSGNDLKLFVYLFSSGITDFTIGLRNRLMKTFENSNEQDDIYYNTYQAIGNKIDEFENEWTASAMYIPIALYVDHETGGWTVYVDGKLTDQYTPFVVNTDKYVYPVRNLSLAKRKNGYVNNTPKTYIIDDTSKREDVIKSIDDFNRQVRQRLGILDDKYLVNTVIIHTEDVNISDDPFDIFKHYFGDNGCMVYSNLINNACDMGVDNGGGNHTLIIDAINNTDVTVSIDDTIVAVITK